MFAPTHPPKHSYLFFFPVSEQMVYLLRIFFRGEKKLAFGAGGGACRVKVGKRGSSCSSHLYPRGVLLLQIRSQALFSCFINFDARPTFKREAKQTTARVSLVKDSTSFGFDIVERSPGRPEGCR